MSEFIGAPGAWQLHCTLGLASCRIRAESLARRLHSKFWTARYDNPGCSNAEDYYERCQTEGIPEGSNVNAALPRPRYGYCWRDSATGAMFATAMANSSSLDDEEFYEAEARFSSPPSPVEDTDHIIVNPPTPSAQNPAMTSLAEDDEEEVEAGEQTKMLRPVKRTSSKMVTSNEELYEKLAQIADSLNMSGSSGEDARCRTVRKDLDECDSGISSNGALFNVASPVVKEPKPINGELFDELEVDLDEDEVETPRGEEVEEVKESVMVGKFSVTPVVEIPEIVETTVEELPSLSASPSGSFKSSFSLESMGCLSLDSPGDDDDDYEHRKVLLRSTSLKSGKTPPGTPRRKKIVRFADALGLDLEAVRHIVSDDLPVIPASAFTDLNLSKSADTTLVVGSVTPSDSRVLYPQFSQPVTDPYFLDRVRNQRVCLENVVINGMSLYGVVRVLNVCFEKTVLVRYTTDDWVNRYEVHGTYIPSSNDEISDRFRFTLHPAGLESGQRVLFAVRYLAEGQEFWDNNYGVNYGLRCHSTSPIAGQGGETVDSPTWMYAYM